MTQTSTSKPWASVPGSFRLISRGSVCPGCSGSRGRGFAAEIFRGIEDARTQRLREPVAKRDAHQRQANRVVAHDGDTRQDVQRARAAAISDGLGIAQLVGPQVPGRPEWQAECRISPLQRFQKGGIRGQLVPLVMQDLRDQQERQQQAARRCSPSAGGSRAPRPTAAPRRRAVPQRWMPRWRVPRRQRRTAPAPVAVPSRPSGRPAAAPA